MDTDRSFHGCKDQTWLNNLTSQNTLVEPQNTGTVKSIVTTVHHSRLHGLDVLFVSFKTNGPLTTMSH